MKYVRILRLFARQFFGRLRISDEIANADILKIIIGAGGTKYTGWISTDYPALDITDEKSWSILFKDRKIEALLAEHVVEHLSDENLSAAISNFYKYLKPSGCIRIAVPDGFHPNREYIKRVMPGGTGLGSDDHKHLFNYKSLPSKFETAGFHIELLEWFDEKGRFNFNKWDPDKGMVNRSLHNDERNKKTEFAYTSLIFDAYKLK